MVTRGVDDEIRVDESGLRYMSVGWALDSVRDDEGPVGSSPNSLHLDVEQDCYALCGELAFEEAAQLRTDGNAGLVDVVRRRHSSDGLRLRVDFLTLFRLEAHIFECVGGGPGGAAFGVTLATGVDGVLVLFDYLWICFAEALKGRVAAVSGGFRTGIVGSSVEADAEHARTAGEYCRVLFEDGDVVARLGQFYG